MTSYQRSVLGRASSLVISGQWNAEAFQGVYMPDCFYFTSLYIVYSGTFKLVKELNKWYYTTFWRLPNFRAYVTVKRRSQRVRCIADRVYIVCTPTQSLMDSWDNKLPSGTIQLTAEIQGNLCKDILPHRTHVLARLVNRQKPI